MQKPSVSSRLLKIMHQPERIYLDNAATSWPKPESVYAAVENYQRNLGTAAGRGMYREAIEVERRVASCRQRLAKLIGAERPEQVVWTCSGTDALNLALFGILRDGDHVVSTVAEHNSVLRPLKFLAEQRGITSTLVRCDAAGFIDPQEIAAAIRPETKLVCVIHASNVTGAVQPIEEIGRFTRERGVRFLVDAAQSVGHLPINVRELGIDLLAAPTHKGLYSPLGLGFLYLAPGLENQLVPLRFGGTGTHSDQDQQPETLPERYEAGNLNVPAILGLEAGLVEIEARGLPNIMADEQAWCKGMLTGLRETPDLEVFGPDAAQPRVGVISVKHPHLDPREMSAALDAVHGIQVRAGIQCAPKMHAALGTLPTGTVRFSSGWINTTQAMATVIAAVSELCESCRN